MYKFQQLQFTVVLPGEKKPILYLFIYFTGIVEPKFRLETWRKGSNNQLVHPQSKILHDCHRKSTAFQ